MKIKTVKFAHGVRCGGNHGNLEELFIDLKDERHGKKDSYALEFNEDKSVKVINKICSRTFIVYPTNIAYIELDNELNPKRANKQTSN